MRIVRGLAGALALLSLAACVPAAGGSATRPDKGGVAPPASVRLSSAGLEVAGPAGYCLDSTASQLADGGAFAVFRRCDVLRGKEVPVPGRAVLTASISDRPNDAPVVSGREPVLIAFFGTEAGRRALSRSGRSDRVEVLQATARDSVVWIRLRDTSEAVALDQVSVRAIFDLGGRIVTVTAASYAEAPLPMSRLSALAEEFVTRIRARNRGATAPAL